MGSRISGRYDHDQKIYLLSTSVSTFGGWSGLNLLNRKDFELLCEVLAAIGVKSSPIKEESMNPFLTRERIKDFMTEERITWSKVFNKCRNVQ